jgi:thiol-disulfide isomerase/thioredoxin
LEDLVLQIEEFQWCPKCGAALNQGASLKPESAPGVVSCPACGATFQPADIASANLAASAQGPARGGNRNPLALVVVALIAAAMLYFGFHMARRSGPTARIGKSTPAPDFTLESLDGKSMSLSDLRGKAVLLNFWATWCGPCKIETPWLVELQNQYGPQGLQIVGVEAGDDDKEEIAKFVKEMGINYPVLLGKDAVGDAYGGIPALPETFFIGRDGKIVGKMMGLRDRSDIEDSIKMALNTQAGSSQAAAAPLAAESQAQK